MESNVCFSVMYSRPSTRKHKKWEGDGYIICRHSAESVLYSETGKELSRCLLTARRFSDLREGEDLMFGSMEIQIQDLLDSVPYVLQSVLGTLGGNGNTEGVAVRKDPEANPALPASKAQAQLSSRTPLVPKRPSFQSLLSPLAKRPALPAISTPPAPKKPFVSPIVRTHDEPSWVIDPTEERGGYVEGFLARHLRPHQKEGIEFIYKRLRDVNGGAILADEMGLGKSVQTIASCLALMKRQIVSPGAHPVRKMLFLVPSSLVNNWKSEFRKWFLLRRFPAITVKRASDITCYQSCHSSTPFLICSYDMALRYAKELYSASFDVLVCDEAHRLKNINGKLREILVSLNIPRRLLLTGTPIQNDLDEFFSLLNFVAPKEFEKARDFRSDCTDEKSGGNSMSDMVYTFMLRRTSEVNQAHLPERNEYILFCRPSPVQKSVIKHIIDFMFGEHLALIHFMRKAANHPALVYKQVSTDLQAKPDYVYGSLLQGFQAGYGCKSVDIYDSGKMATIVALLNSFKETGESTVIFSNYTQTLDMLSCLCSSLGFRLFRIDGSTCVADRQKIVETFNATESAGSVFLLSTKAGGVGLNLIGASRLILFDSDWNPAADLQAMARIWRDGQKRVCHIYRLVLTGTIDEKILQRQIKKAGLSAVVDLDQLTESSDIVKFRDEDLMDIFSLCESDCQTHDLLECRCEGTGVLPREMDQEQDEIEMDPVLIPEEETHVEDEDQLEEGADDVEKEAGRTSMAELFSWRHFSPLQQDSWTLFCETAGLVDIVDEVSFAMHLSTKF